MKEHTYSRRKFILKNMGMLTVFLVGAEALSGCGSSDNKNKAASDLIACDDLSQVSKGEIQKREKLSYVTETPVPGSDCNNCQFHIPGKYKENIGGCLLFDGPVCPDGYCTQYAKAET